MKKGFTIIELIISIFILSIAIIGVYASFSVMNILSSEASDRLVAAYLAQEGLEIIRNIRDTNWIEASQVGLVAWDDGLEPCEGDLGCEVDYKTTGSVANPVYPWQDRFLKISENNAFYGYSDGLDTKFKRKITVDKTLAPYILKVAAEVSWRQKPTIINPNGKEDSIVVEDVLYDWY